MPESSSSASTNGVSNAYAAYIHFLDFVPRSTLDAILTRTLQNMFLNQNRIGNMSSISPNFGTTDPKALNAPKMRSMETCLCTLQESITETEGQNWRKR